MKKCLKLYVEHDNERINFFERDFYKFSFPAEAVSIVGPEGASAKIERMGQLKKGKHCVVLTIPLAFRDEARKSFVSEAFEFYKSKLNADFEFSSKNKDFKKILTNPNREDDIWDEAEDGSLTHSRIRSKKYSDYQVNQKRVVVEKAEKAQRDKKIYVEYQKGKLPAVHYWFKHGQKKWKDLHDRTIFKIVKQQRKLKKEIL